MLSRQVPKSTRAIAARTTPMRMSQARSYAAEHTGKGGSVPPFQPRKAFSPYLLAGGAVALIFGWYQISKKDPPKTVQVSGIERAMQPKIDQRSGDVGPGEAKVTKRH